MTVKRDDGTTRSYKMSVSFSFVIVYLVTLLWSSWLVIFEFPSMQIESKGSIYFGTRKGHLVTMGLFSVK